MTPEVIAGYLSRLLGRPVAAGDTVQLSSAQRGRFVAWLEEAGVAVAAAAVPHALQVAEFARAHGVAAADTAPGARPLDERAGAAAGAATAHPVRVGIDLQAVAELVDAQAARDPKASAELCRIFSMRELSYATARGTVADTLTGIFAAKEALCKADPSLRARDSRSLEVLPDEHGAPQFPGYSLSISHSGGFAVAVAVAHRVPSDARLEPVRSELPGARAAVPGGVSGAGDEPNRPASGGGLLRFASVALVAGLVGALIGHYWAP
jgi:phosphopantetheinyl transferase (holo-ACP synthase)